MTSNLIVTLAASAWALVGVGVGALAVGAAVALVIYRAYAKNKVGLAKQEAARITEEAQLEAKTLRKEALIEAKEEQHRLRTEFEQESKERKAEFQRTEQRLLQKENFLDKKDDALDKKQDQLDNQKRILEAKNKELELFEENLKTANQRIELELERVAGLSKDEAKQNLYDSLIDGVKKDAAQEAKNIEKEAKDNAEKLAKNIISLAIQRCAADHATETTVSVVALPNDEMKGRIIGRVGRNIRALESATGVDVIIDDTPDVVTLSGFDPIRREVARLTLEKLIADGRIHPTHIEEMVNKARREVDAVIKSEGERAVLETGVRGLHPELVKLLGRLHYRTSYGQNVLQHSIEVAHLAGMMAAELGADVATAKRAGLLHDIGKAVDHELEGTHVALGVEFLRKYHEREDVIHAVQAHHNDVEPQTVVACLVQAADAISAARPGARRENIENYIKRLEKLEEITGSYPGVETSYAIQAGREVRVMVKPEQVSEDDMVILARELAKRIESELEYPGQIKVHVLRETKVIEYAK